MWSMVSTPHPGQTGLGEDGGEERKQTGGIIFCLAVLNNTGGFLGTKKEDESRKALQVEGAESAMMGNWFVPARAETAGEQQLVGMVWSTFAELWLWSRGERLACHGARHLLECEQHTSKRTVILIFFSLCSLSVGLQAL